jgi:hypothetical protein
MLGDSTDDQFGILEGERWMDPQFEQIARSVALMYGFENPGEFMESMNLIWKTRATSFRVGAPGSSTTNQGTPETGADV